MFDLYSWELGRRYRMEEDRRRAARALLLDELRRSRPSRLSVSRHALHALGTLLIRCGRFLQRRGTLPRDAGTRLPAAQPLTRPAAAPSWEGVLHA